MNITYIYIIIIIHIYNNVYIYNNNVYIYIVYYKQQTSPSNFPSFVANPRVTNLLPEVLSATVALGHLFTVNDSTMGAAVKKYGTPRNPVVVVETERTQTLRFRENSIILGYLRETYMIYIYMGNFAATDFRENYIEIIYDDI